MTLEDEAIIARQKFENKTISESLLVNLYTKYTEVEDPILFVRTAKKLFPKGNCGLATLYLKERLGTGELIQGMYGTYPHTYLMVGEEVVDITADQYGGPKIYVGSLATPWSKQ